LLAQQGQSEALLAYAEGGSVRSTTDAGGGDRRRRETDAGGRQTQEGDRRRRGRHRRGNCQPVKNRYFLMIRSTRGDASIDASPRFYTAKTHSGASPPSIAALRNAYSITPSARRSSGSGDFRRLLHRQVGRLFSLEDATIGPLCGSRSSIASSRAIKRSWSPNASNFGLM